ncbi:2Fe-2S iron-sulfur cluster binding domain-containing protein [Acidaminobacter sp. JC074]|uniref:2Fe-2S iron-sulfur cluster-binding protein n=1 Tax=Acidaminobacter sp. JC074 TaxID=2530199 RepID=UPI001F10F66D|nr:2Fe-2S iron-sulfur cluster-binding protein [Acidaminobacter sp. JC074]MCH4888381.1 2Fe-2S iron-sulfur cluster binding domain-containing protein [Acidaminobacter sp. JC074]
MKIKIDGKDIQVEDANKNIVEIADEHGITITAPCFRNKKRSGCCKACLIEVDGQKKYACGTKPEEGMEIVYQREDLSAVRKERLKLYADNIKNGNSSSNTCGVSPVQIKTL